MSGKIAKGEAHEVSEVSGPLLDFRGALRAGAKRVATFSFGNLSVEVSIVGSALFAFARRAEGGGLALRAATWSGEGDVQLVAPREGEAARFRITADAGDYLVAFSAAADAFDLLRCKTHFTPARSLYLPFVPRDLFVLDARDDPLGARGRVIASQRGLNAGLVYFHSDDGGVGTALYFQNLTALNPYFAATGTKPEDAVGGIWPELGYLVPVPAEGGAAAEPLPPGREVPLSDAILVLRPGAPSDERQSARYFLQMLAAAYREIEAPRTDFRDWPGRAERTLRDLDRAPEATVAHYGHRYVHPYTAAEYPDSMVQMSIISALCDWGKWSGEPHPLEAEFLAGMNRFYDRELGTLRRYLPNVGADKDADAVDSWYLYHPLLNLAKLALGGNPKARALFLDSIDFAIKVAHHFDYQWPIQFKVTDFSVITAAAGADGRGQTDVGGFYAMVMLRAFELTDDKRYLDEARAAIDAAIGLGFALNYQANLTAWGAVACMRLWRITNRKVYLEQSYVYLASFFHNCEIWESEIGLAVHYRNFMGVTCLQDAPYMAMYECFEAFAAFDEYLAAGGPELDPAARLLVSEYCRYALDRAWYYYPDALPRDAISSEQRAPNGHVDRALNFPLEDLYPDGQPAGQVGQEVYGAGAAFVFATRGFHRIEGAPFLLAADHFIRVVEPVGERRLVIQLDGEHDCFARLSIVRQKRKRLPPVRLSPVRGAPCEHHAQNVDRIDFRVAANARYILSW
ncbi:hypothetical protein GGC65_001370 [Sphingopyxis sp. OAS728]|uniref:hypothetical protein n=1 Tax=Sphingopyxis sp. OAS728 TaxID=2663823 RepID=UPI0019E6DDFC|nr:hypothetical protein [Sphingopyxis sp. OAS728]MBE1526914.1 hypothetical protein [Sphingopyxis sp. OAS728]